MLKDYQPNQIIQLPPIGSWPQVAHVVEDDALWALRAAKAANRPLLIRGEPGTGKSQLARAAAVMMERAFLSTVVHARQECTDLLWRFDAVARLGEAQVLAVNPTQDPMARLDAKRFLAPGILWWAFNWPSAQTQARRFAGQVPQLPVPKDWTADQGCVVLIDEIDKAETDLPNGLLEVLGNGAFPVPHHQDAVGHTDTPPLVILTTNEERALPNAFLRRCLVLHLELPKDQIALKEHLTARGRAHGEGLPDQILEDAAQMLVEDRAKAQSLGRPAPGQAEYLDLLQAVGNLAELGEDPAAVLQRIAPFALSKNEHWQ